MACWWKVGLEESGKVPPVLFSAMTADSRCPQGLYPPDLLVVVTVQVSCPTDPSDLSLSPPQEEE